jgi:hypothetical protein
MPTFGFTNSASTTLASAMTDTTGTSAVVASVTGFPSTTNQQFDIIVDSEIMTVTNNPGTGTFTVIRGVDGSTAATHASGAPVYHGWTAEAASNMVQLSPSAAQTGDIILTGNIYAGGTGVSPTAHIQTAAGTTTVPPIRLTSGTNLTTPLSGAIEYDGTNTYISTAGAKRRSVVSSTFPGPLTTTSFTNTETVVATASLAAGDLNVAGRQVWCRIYGRYTTTNAASPTMTVRVRLGGLTGTVIFNTTPTTTALTVSLTNAPIMFEFLSTVRTTGTSGTIWTNGVFNVATASAGPATLVVSPQYPTAAVTVNLTTLTDWVVTMVSSATTATLNIDQAEVFVS